MSDPSVFERELGEATAARDAGRFDDARRLLVDLLALHPDHPRLLYQLAWTHDAMGAEADAVPFYERAIAAGLDGDELRGALLGLGSTLRALGRYDQAVQALEEGRRRFPEDRAFAVFLAMALHNTGRHEEAMELLLRALAATSSDPRVQRYRRAIDFYADKLGETWT